MQQFKEALAAWVVRFHRQIAPMTPALSEFVGRDASSAVALVPGRMVDAAEDMLTLWMRNEPKGGPTKPHKLPVILVAVARDPNPTMVGRNRSISSPVHVILPGDVKERVFELKTMARDYRAQLLFVAQDSDTAESLAMQFGLWLENWRNQVFDVKWEFAGNDVMWPAQLESPDVAPSVIATDAKSVTMIAVDVSFCSTQPIYRAVGEGEVFKAADGTLQEQTSGTGLEGNLPRSKVQAEGFPYTEQVKAQQKLPGSATPVTKHDVDGEGTHSV